MPLVAGVSGLNNARVDAALLAAGAWDVAPLEFPCAGASWLGVHVTYDEDPAATDGAVDVQLELSPYAVAANVPTGAEEWIPQTLYAPGAVVPGADTESLAQAEYITFDPTLATPQAITFAPVAIRGVFERFRVRARESGDIANPGDCQITVTLYDGHMFGVQ